MTTKRITLDVQESFLDNVEVPEGHSRKQVLEAMLQEQSEPEVSTENPTAPQLLDPFRIKFNPYQPRQELNFVSIQELADSIESEGLLQPITVRPVGDEYQVAFGHRRLAAWQQLYESHEGGDYALMPCFVRQLSDEEMYRLAASENGQREDLTIIEIARSIERAKEVGLTQEAAGRLHGYQSKGTISSIVQLLTLPGEVQTMLIKGDLGFGHGRELVRLVKAGFEASDVTDYAERTLSMDLKVSVLKNNVDAQLQHKKEIETLETRYCYWCNHEQQVSDYDKINHISTQCEACGKQTFAYQWLTEKKTCARCAKELDSERVFDYSQYQSEPICPDCAEAEASTATEPPAATAGELERCPVCEEQTLDITSLHCEHCGMIDRQARITRYCPNCYQSRLVSLASLNDNETLECDTCGTTRPSQDWLTEKPDSETEELEPETQSEVSTENPTQTEIRYCPACYAPVNLMPERIEQNWYTKCGTCGNDASLPQDWLTEEPELDAEDLEAEAPDFEPAEEPELAEDILAVPLTDEELQETLTAPEYATIQVVFRVLDRILADGNFTKEIKMQIVNELLEQ